MTDNTVLTGMVGKHRSRAGGNRFVARGVAHVEIEHGDEPVLISFVLVPQFTMLAFTAAIEPLRAANQLAGTNLFEWRILSDDGQPVIASNGVGVTPDEALPELSPGQYVFVCGGVEPELTTTAALADWIRLQWRRGRCVGSLCSGAYTLAGAGILKDKRFTLHWENIPGFREAYPDLEPKQLTYCMDGRVITCSGGVAAAEMALQLVIDHYGPELGQAAMNMCLLTNMRKADDPQVLSLAARIGTRNAHVVRAVAYLETNLEGEFYLPDCAAHAGVSVRQIQRLFKKYLGMNPTEYMSNLRLQRARMLLSETNMSVTEIALACGYGSPSNFSKCFRKKFGVSPNRFSHFPPC